MSVVGGLVWTLTQTLQVRNIFVQLCNGYVLASFAHQILMNDIGHAIVTQTCWKLLTQAACTNRLPNTVGTPVLPYMI